MSNFEQAFRGAENAAAAMLSSAEDLARLAKQLQKASREGNIGALRKVQEKLDDVLASMSQTVANAERSWPFEEGDEEQYLNESYADELRRLASDRGLEIHERDARLVAHPSILRILPGERRVRIDKKKIATIRPSYLVELLLKSQNKGGRYQTAAFLESLYNVYVEIVREERRDLMRSGGSGSVVPLDRIYRLLTSLPGSARDYDRTDFARDLYLLDANGPERTKKGATVSFPSATGTRRSRGLFTFLGPDGGEVDYFAIQFTEGG